MRLVIGCRRAAWCFILLASTTVAVAQETVTRQPKEAPADFAARLLPQDRELAHTVVEGTFGPGPGNIVILFRARNDVNTNYTGWVLVPAGSSRYRKYELPAMPEIPSRFEITVNAVMFANADKDAAREMLVLYSYHRNGSEDDDSNAVHAYDWTGRGFTGMAGIDRNLAGLKTAAAVRRKLKSMGH